MRKRSKGKAEAEKGMSSATAWCLVALVVAFVAIVRVRLLGVPLERDEGEFAYMGRLLLQGVPPYGLAANMKLPGIYGAYALVMAVFGQTIWGIHLGLLLVNAAGIVLVFLLGRRLLDPVAGVVACATYAMATLSYGVLGSAAHATHFVVLFALAGLMVLLKALDRAEARVGAESVQTHTFAATFFWAGLLLGIAYLMKQPGVFFLVFGVFYAGWRLLGGSLALPRLALPQIGALVAGGVIPFAITCLALWAAGVFDRFWFWTVDYGREYASLVPARSLFRLFGLGLHFAAMGTWPLWAISAVGLTAAAWDRRVRSQAVFLLGLLAFGIAATAAGFYCRPHYFVMMLPAVALPAGAAVSSAYRLASKKGIAVRALPILVFLAALAYPMWQERDYLFVMSPVEISRKLYGSCPCPEAVEIGRYLKSHAARGDHLVVMGSEPQIYFYSGLRSATSYLYTYGLMEKQKYAARMQSEMRREIEKAQPRYLVSVVSKTSWNMGPHSRKDIVYWYEDYVKRHYERVGLIDMVAPEQIYYYWDTEAASGEPRSPTYLEVFRRKGP